MRPPARGVVQNENEAGKGPVARWLEQDHEDEDQLLINNRQNGRRRGRGGGGPRSPNQAPMGNRQDNRSRGNAAQLHEKYKALARDAQMQGDRVQSEYWLQFAEHYYRRLNENRARFEEQRRDRDDYGSDEDQDEGPLAAEGEEGDEGEERDTRDDRGDRNDRGDRGRDRFEGRDRPRRDYREERNGEPRGERFRPRRDRDEPRPQAADEGEERISLDVLPPAIAVVEGDGPAKTPRRRTRRPRDEDGEEIAPAA